MLGVVLSGGLSTRMGSDKGLLKLHANTWAQTAIDKLSELQLPIIISVNKQQVSEYSAIFSPQQLVTDNDSLKIRGPLCGVLSVHLQYPSEDLVILACDMPLMEPLLLKELYNYYLQNPGTEVYIFTNDNEPEPLCGIYTAKGLSKIIALQKENKLVKHSMKFILSQLSVYTVIIKEEQKKYFRNFNAHAELNGL